MRSVVSGASRVLLVAVGALCAAVLGALLFPFLFGFKTSVVVTGSMEPHIHVGDAVVGHRVSPLSVHVGDVVTFSDPDGSGRNLTHRIIAIQSIRGDVRLTTKGDANSTVERFLIPRKGFIGLVSYRVPQVGYFLVHLRGPFARILLVAVPALALAVMELLRIWRAEEVASASAA